jgi:hypothetical protein
VHHDPGAALVRGQLHVASGPLAPVVTRGVRVPVICVAGHSQPAALARTPAFGGRGRGSAGCSRCAAQAQTPRFREWVGVVQCAIVVEGRSGDRAVAARERLKTVLGILGEDAKEGRVTGNRRKNTR